MINPSENPRGLVLRSPFASRFRLLALATALHIAVAPSVALAVTEAPAATDMAEVMKALKEQEKRLAEQESRLKTQQQQLEKQQQDFLSQKKEFEQLQTRLNAVANAAPQQAAPVAKVSSEPAPDNSQPPIRTEATTPGAAPVEVVGTDRKPLPAEKPPEIAQIIEEGGVLLGKGKLVITPSMEYLRSSATRVSIEGFSIIPALNIGVFDVTQVGRNSVTAAVSGRIGLTNRIEVDAKIPALYRSDYTRSRPVGVGVSQDTVTDASGYGIGDVEAGIHYQINRGQDGWPFLIANLRVKSTTGTSPFEVDTTPQGIQTELPTGSGFWAFQPSITAIYPSDPAVFFSNWGYLYNMKRDIDGIGEVDPGDAISGSVGMSISLNDRASFSFSYGHSTVFNNAINGVTAANSTFLQIGTIDLGYSYNLTDNINLNLNVSAGVTEDAPDSRVTFRMPIAFDAF